MKKICCMAICFAHVYYVGMAIATDNAYRNYLKAEVGPIMLQKFSQNDYYARKPLATVVADVGIGNYLNDNISADISLYYMPKGKFNKVIDGELITQKFKTHAAFIGMNYEWNLYNTSIMPFFTAGVGMAINDADDYNFRRANGEYSSIVGKSNTDFAFNAGLGAKFALKENCMLSLAYRYFEFGQMKTASVLVNHTTDPNVDPAAAIASVKTKLRAHSVMLGFTHRF